MKRLLFMPAILILGACASTAEDEDKDDDVSAVRDFIEVSELGTVNSIRTVGQLGQIVLNDRYVIVTTKREQYLLEYAQRCRLYNDEPRRADVRSDPRHIYAKADTFRGCRIGAMYPITKEQAEELETLGRAPGERR